MGGPGGAIVNESDLDALVGRRISIDVLTGHYHDTTGSTEPLRRLSDVAKEGEAAQGRASGTPIPSGRLKGYRELELARRWAIDGGGTPPLQTLPMVAIEKIVAVCEKHGERYLGLAEYDADRYEIRTSTHAFRRLCSLTDHGQHEVEVIDHLGNPITPRCLWCSMEADETPLLVDPCAPCVDCRQQFGSDHLDVDSRCPGCAEVHRNAQTSARRTIWERMWDFIYKLLSPLWL